MVVLLPGEIDDQSWNTGNYKGIMECRKALDVELRYEKNVSAGASGEAMLSVVCRQGISVQSCAAGTQVGGASCRRVADQYPEVWLVMGKGEQWGGCPMCRKEWAGILG